MTDYGAHPSPFGIADNGAADPGDDGRFILDHLSPQGIWRLLAACINNGAGAVRVLCMATPCHPDASAMADAASVLSVQGYMHLEELGLIDEGRQDLSKKALML
jgi:hypothetical protein